MTPPELHRMSGITNTPLPSRMRSASGVVGPLAPSATIRALTRSAFSLGDLVLERGGTRMSQSYSTIGVVSGWLPGKPDDAAAVGDVADQRRDVEARRGCGSRPRRRTPPRSWRLRAPSGRPTTEPTLPKPWTATRAPASGTLEMAARLAHAEQHAAPGRFATSERAAQLERLAGDHRGLGAPLVHRVGVHEPRHHLFVGVDVRSRDVALGTEQIRQVGRVATGQSFEFALRQFARDRTRSRPCRRRTGMLTTAHFQVIHAASASTSSSVTSG